jgi:hypothetical protein
LLRQCRRLRRHYIGSTIAGVPFVLPIEPRAQKGEIVNAQAQVPIRSDIQQYPMPWRQAEKSLGM